MRNISIIILLCLIPALTRAQDSSFTFKGIPLEGTCVSFSEALKSKGFVSKGTLKDGSVKMSGSFAGRMNIQTVIGPVSETDNRVKTITLSVPTANGTWNELTELFGFYKKHYTSKYGEPAELSEKGTGEDYRCIADLKKGICHYHAQWLTEFGDIHMTLQSVSSTVYVVITYTDAKGRELAEKEIMNDI